jgi:hypothetical protein
MSRIVDECEFLSVVEGKHPLAFARGVSCPREAVADVEKLLKAGGLDRLPVVEAGALRRG